MALTTTLLMAIVFAGLSLVGGECTTNKEEAKTTSLEYKMMFSEVVAHGLTISAEQVSDSSNNLYSVLFEIRCIYKGGALDELIRINRVGYNPDNCLTTNLTVNSKSLVFLNKTVKGEYVQTFRPESGDAQYVEEIVVLCEATVRYPNGIDDNNRKEICPEEYRYDDCIARPDLSTPSTSDGESSEETTDPQTKDKQNGGGYDNSDLAANPPYSDAGDGKSSEETTDSQTKDNKNGESNVAYKSVDSSDIGTKKNPNGAATLTLHISALVCILTVSIFQLTTTDIMNLC